MAKPVAGEVVVIPFPQTDLTLGKRRPALVIVDLPGQDVILCQITSRARSDNLSVALGRDDFERGQLNQPSLIRPQRLFTVDPRHHLQCKLPAALCSTAIGAIKSFRQEAQFD